jgi:hypothetical protein
MRLRSWVVSMTALLTAATAMTANAYPLRTGGNYSGPGWYGYFFNNNLVAPSADHTNITMIGAPELNDSTRVSDAISTIEARLLEAQNHGQRAMVDIEAIVFVETGASGNACYGDDMTAATDFQTLVTTLETDGYLIANHPESGTVFSFYVADEPDRSCTYSLEDVLGGPAPALLDAITAIRGNLDTANFPLATIVTKDNYSDMPIGLGLFDWISFDDYANGYGTYLTTLSGFETITQSDDVVGGTPQRYFMVPGVTLSAGTPYTGGAPSFYSRFVTDTNVIGIMPFKWSVSTDSNGMNATSTWAPPYISLGRAIVTGTTMGSIIPSVAITAIASYSIFN